jgi:hypothetical protein
MSELATALGWVKANVRDVKDVVFLVGAGLSVKSGFDLWPKSTSKALESGRQRGLSDGAYQYASEKLRSNDLYGVFGILKDSLSPAVYRVIILDTFAGPNKANDTQKLLVSVPARGVITTNFDECLIAARVHVNGETPLSSIQEILASKTYYITQPHGTIRNPETMVLTKSDWEDVLRKKLFRQLLEQVVSENQLIILGYGVADPDFLHIWNGLLHERIFHEVALLCCSSGTVSSTSIAEFKSKNIQVVEFDDPNHNYAYIDEVLKAFIGPADPTKTVSISLFPKKVEDLERYVMLCMEFAPDQVSRLELVCRAVILEQMVEKPAPITNKELVLHVCSTLGESSQTITDATARAIALLLHEGKVTNMTAGLILTDEARSSIDTMVRAAESKELSALRQVLSAHRPVTLHNDLSIDIFQVLVDRTFASFGMDVAEFFLYGRPSKIPNESIDSIVGDYCGPLNIPLIERTAYADAVKRFVIQPEDGYAAVVFRKLQAYFITSAFVLSPTSEKLLAEYAKDHLVYLDSSIILPAIAIGHSSHPLYRSMLSSTSRLGMRLRVSRAMLDEVTHNIRTANSAFKTFGDSVATMQDILSGYLTLQGRGNGNVFIEGFAAELELDPNLTPLAYMRMVVGETEPSDDTVASMLADRYGIELDPSTDTDLDLDEVSRLTATIAHIRKQGNRFKTDLLCKHEALQFALIQKRRVEHPELFSKIWFITTDFFFVELQRLERSKYPVPISYNPRLWFQYLNLLDHEARGSANYSKLQHRMSYGVAVGGMGLSAIYQILKEKKDLIEKGVATVQEMAQAIVDDYHIHRSIDNYAFSIHKTDDEKDSYAAVKLRVQNAIGKLTTIRVQEIEKLKIEKEDAIIRAAKAEKALAKQKHVNRTVRGYAMKKKPKRRR